MYRSHKSPYVDICYAKRSWGVFVELATGTPNLIQLLMPFLGGFTRPAAESEASWLAMALAEKRTTTKRKEKKKARRRKESGQKGSVVSMMVGVVKAAVLVYDLSVRYSTEQTMDLQ